MEKNKIKLEELFPLIQEKLESGGDVVFTVTGSSMLPFMKDGKTLVTIKQIDKKLKKHDIVFYKNNGKFILHRILKITSNYIITCGDGLTKLEYIKESDIFAKVVKFQNGHVLTDVKNIFYRFKVNIWLLLRPFRRYLLFILRKIKKL